MADLQRQAQDAQEQLFRIRFQMGMGQSEGLKKYRGLKKDRARMLTILQEKEAAGETAIPLPAPKSAKSKAADKSKNADKKKK